MKFTAFLPGATNGIQLQGSILILPNMNKLLTAEPDLARNWPIPSLAKYYGYYMLQPPEENDKFIVLKSAGAWRISANGITAQAHCVLLYGNNGLTYEDPTELEKVFYEPYFNWLPYSEKRSEYFVMKTDIEVSIIAT